MILNSNKKKRFNNTAVIGDRIEFLYYNMPARGVVCKVYDNSVLTTLEILDTTTKEYEEVIKVKEVPEKTVVNWKRYTVKEWL